MKIAELLPTLQRKLISLDSLLLVGLRTLSKFLLLIFVLLCARLLSQEDFGDFQFVDTLTVQALQLLVVAAMIVTRIGCCFPEASRGGNLRWLHDRSHAKMLLAAAALAALGVALDPFMRQTFLVEARWCFAASGLTVGAYMLFCYYMGMLQVLERFRAIGVLFLVMGLVPLALAALLFPGGVDVLEAYACVSAGTVAATAAAWLIVRRALPARPVPVGTAMPRLDFAWVYILAIGLFLIMHNMDIWATKLFLDRSGAGYYARFEFVGKIIFMISSSLTIILFPKVGKAHEHGDDPHHYLLRCLRGFGLLTVLFAGGTIGLFDVISPIMFGKDLSDGLALLSVVILAKSAQSLVFILINYEAARGGKSMLPWLAMALALETTLFIVFGISPAAVAASAAVTATLTAGALFLKVWKTAPKPRTCSARSQPHIPGNTTGRRGT